jgi:hypothetical protein
MPKAAGYRGAEDFVSALRARLNPAVMLFNFSTIGIAGGDSDANTLSGVRSIGGHSAVICSKIPDDRAVDARPLRRRVRQ